MIVRNASVFLPVLLACGSLFAQQQPTLDALGKQNLHMMLDIEQREVAKYYYDPTLRGVDVNALYKKLDGQIDHAQTLNQGFMLVAAFMQSFKDSHLFFIPPPRSYRSDSGFEFQMVGDQCFITRVRPRTEAAAKLHPGDEVLQYDGFKPERRSFHTLRYEFSVLTTTQASDLYLKAPDGTMRHEIVHHRIIKGYQNKDFTEDMEVEHEIRKEDRSDKEQRGTLEVVGDVAVWKQPHFDVSDTEVATAIRKAGHHKALVLDLRGNAGGDVDTLKAMVGGLMDHDVTIATLKARKPEKPMLAKSMKSIAFPGPVFVLVDNKSASASELLARVVQLEHRGKVLGDQTAGAVMEAKWYPEHLGQDTIVPFDLSITRADLIMSDGQSLEGHGVVPDERLLPTANDLANGLDPVLAQAITEAGATISPEDAGKLFPFKWPELDLD